MEFFAAAAGGVLTIAGAPFVLGLAGFTSAGIAATSVAAGVQASIGNVVVGSTFAALQSAGAAGLAAPTTAALGFAGATGGAVLCAAAECAGKEQLSVNCETKMLSYVLRLTSYTSFQADQGSLWIHDIKKQAPFIYCQALSQTPNPNTVQKPNWSQVDWGRQ